MKVKNKNVKPMSSFYYSKVHYAPLSVAQEHAPHVGRAGPHMSSIFLLMAPWHCWPARLPAAVMFADAEVKHRRSDLCDKCQHTSELVSCGHLHCFGLFKGLGFLPPPPTNIWFASTESWTNDEPQLDYANRKRSGGGGLHIGQAVRTEFESGK